LSYLPNKGAGPFLLSGFFPMIHAHSVDQVSVLFPPLSGTVVSTLSLSFSAFFSKKDPPQDETVAQLIGGGDPTPFFFLSQKGDEEAQPPFSLPRPALRDILLFLSPDLRGRGRGESVLAFFFPAHFFAAFFLFFPPLHRFKRSYVFFLGEFWDDNRQGAPPFFFPALTNLFAPPLLSTRGIALERRADRFGCFTFLFLVDNANPFPPAKRCGEYCAPPSTDMLHYFGQNCAKSCETPRFYLLFPPRERGFFFVSFETVFMSDQVFSSRGAEKLLSHFHETLPFSFVVVFFFFFLGRGGRESVSRLSLQRTFRPWSLT